MLQEADATKLLTYQKITVVALEYVIRSTLIFQDRGDIVHC